MHVGRRGGRTNVGGFHSRLAALSRLHSKMHLCSWQCGTESRTRVFAMEKHPFLVLSSLCRRSLFFPPEYHHFDTFFPLCLLVRSFYFARSTDLRKSFLKGGIYLFLRYSLITTIFLLYLEFFARNF